MKETKGEWILVQVVAGRSLEPYCVTRYDLLLLRVICSLQFSFPILLDREVEFLALVGGFLHYSLFSGGGCRRGMLSWNFICLRA